MRKLRDTCRRWEVRSSAVSLSLLPAPADNQCLPPPPPAPAPASSILNLQNAVQPDHMSIRRKTMEVMSLLYDAARHTHVTHPPAPGGTRLNPTSGVQNNRPPLDGLVTFRADPTQPGGGVFVAENEAVKSAFDQQGLVSGTVINKPAVTVKPNIANSGGDLAVGDSNTQGLSAGRPSRGRTNSVNGSWK